MIRFSSVWQRGVRVVSIGLFALTLNACDDGDRGLQGPPGVATVTPSSASSFSMTVDSVTIDSPPVVVFSVGDQAGNPVSGISADDLRFTLAKLMPGSNGDPGAWQSYILTTQTASASGAPGFGNTAVQATREEGGTLVDNQDGTYSYTFATDVTNVSCPAPCTDADGNALDVSYQPTLTHRLGIQTRGSLPAVNVTYDFRPSDGATTGLVTRKIVATESCNECHNELELHDARIETDYCVTCHNPGSTDPDSGNTVDFKVMVHKIHRGINLPSVVGPDGEFEDDSGTPEDETADNGEYAIWGYRDSKHDYSTVHYPQDIRFCTKCHTGDDASTPDGDNWNTQISMQACGSCHDDVDFSLDGSAAGANDPDGHSGGIVTDNSLCSTCHAEGRVAASVEQSHYLAEPVAREKFQLNILAICGTPVGTDPGPICAPGTNPSVTFSVTDPTNNDAEYPLDAPEIAGSNLSFLIAWDTDDYHNTDGTGTRPARAASIDFDEIGFVDSGNTRTVTATFVIPNGGGTTGYVAEGSGAVGAQGRLAGDFDGDGSYTDRIYVKNEVAFFRIDDAMVQPRRPTVSNDKCNQCHDQVSFHGGSRSGEYGVCILCHNPNNTDIAARNDPGASLPAPDGKVEESIDLRRMIHGIHAGARTLYDGSDGHGFREQGLVVYGYRGSTHDYSHVRFPGILNDCETCHVEGAYLLEDRWASPTANGLLSSTITSNAAADPADDLNITPTAAVCSACHDSDVARAHMQVPGGAVFNETQANITASYTETCSICHGPGKSADVEVVHGVD